MIKLKFCGAAKTVTGSNYLVTTDSCTFVVDCGMFQGAGVEQLNLEELTYNAKNVDFVLLTHAHIDHSGMLPKLYNGGFRGPIFATSNTIQIVTELLMDSAKLQEAAFQRGDFYGKYTNQKAIVYNTKEAIETLAMMKSVRFEDEFSPADGINVKYLRAGHILGAASIEVDIKDNLETKKIIFSGDIGRVKSHIDDSFDRSYKSNPDYVLMESLYGGQVHPDRDESARELVKIINETVNNGGNVYIPCFAVQRTQEVLNDIRNAKKSGEMSNDVNVWLDSPLAQRVTGIYTAALQDTEENLFDFENLHYVKKYKQSLGLSKKSGQVIIAGSGMADGGRIVEHLTKALEIHKNAVIFVGFQAEGTPGRELVQHASEVELDKKKVKVKAKIYHLQGFSAHGDTNDYQIWLKRFASPKLKKVFLVHAEPDRSRIMGEELEEIGIKSAIPGMQEEVVL